MRITKGIWVILFIIVLISSSALADDIYPYVSGEDYDYQTGNGIFNAQMTSAVYEINSKIVNQQRQLTPLVVDLDNDGTNEIIILDGDVLRLFHHRTLDIVDSFAVENISGYPYFTTFDIDSDGRTEIIVVSSSSNAIDIIEYNGSIMKIETSFSLNKALHGEIMVTCSETEDKCVVIYNTATSDNAGGVFGRVFDSSTLYAETTFELLTGFARNCFPKIPNIVVTDYDGDGTEEFIYSYFHIERNAGNDKAYIDYAFINASNMLQKELRITITDIDEVFTTGGSVYPDNCIDGKWGNYLTSPLIFNLDGSSSNHMETVIAYMVDDDEFIMRTFDETGSPITRYPNVYEADGVIVSNPVRANIFDGSGNQDFCVLGYATDDNELDLLCGSETDTWKWLFIDYETVEFIMDAPPYNITDEYWNYEPIIHASQQATIYEEHEIVSSYGVHHPDWTDNYGIQIPPRKTLDLIWENPYDNAVVIPVDAEQAFITGGLEDMLVLTSSNFYYIDDGFSNDPAEVTYYCVNPCLDTTWKINTTVSVHTFQVQDGEGDQVSGKAVLYQGDVNEQLDTINHNPDGWSNNVTSEADLQFYFIANKTIGAGNLILYGRDTTNPNDIDTVSLSFTVSSQGVEYGDCETCIDIITEIEQPEPTIVCSTDNDCPTNYICYNNKCVRTDVCSTDDDCATGYSCIGTSCVEDEDTLPVQAMDEASEVFNIPKTALYLMFMMGLAIAFWFAPVSKRADFFDSANARFGAIIIGESFMLILGTYFGWLPLAIIITIVILALIAFSIWVVKRFTGSPTG